MKLIINGEEREVRPQTTINDLLTEFGLHPDRVVLELNREILSAEVAANRQLTEADQLEIIQFVGGG